MATMGSSPRFALLTFVRVISSAFHVASLGFKFNHLSSVSLKQAALFEGLSFSIVLST